MIKIKFLELESSLSRQVVLPEWSLHLSSKMREMKVHIYHPLHKIAKKEEVNRLQHLDEFSHNQMVEKKD